MDTSNTPGTTSRGSSDEIVEYVLTVQAGQWMYCGTCGLSRLIWQGRTAENQILTCCGTCQSILIRQSSPSIASILSPIPRVDAAVEFSAWQTAETQRVVDQLQRICTALEVVIGISGPPVVAMREAIKRFMQLDPKVR